MLAAIYTLGCKVNQYETQAMEQELVRRGHTLVPFDQRADAYIVNTCSVTAVSDKKSRQMLRRCRKLNPEAVVAAAKATVLEAYQSARTEGYNAGAEFDDWRVEYLAEDWSQTYSGGTLVAYNMNYEYHAGKPAAIMLAGGSQGKLSNSATVLVYYIYENAFDYWKLGYASAVAMVLFVLVLAVTIIQFAYEKKLED